MNTIMIKKLHIHKFGGSSLADASRFRAISKLISGQHEIIVVSATAGTTKSLQAVLDIAVTGNAYADQLAALCTHHEGIMGELLEQAHTHTLLAQLKVDCAVIHNIAETAARVRAYSKAMQDLVLSFGELWSAQILAAFLEQAHYVDAKEIIHTYFYKNQLTIDWKKSEAALHAFLQTHNGRTVVIPGFTANDENNCRTTLGLNGSDFSAAIVAKLADAEQLTIWKDVDGIFSADPRKVPSAFVLNELSYKEASELAYFGAGVLHPRAIAPAIERHIPIVIRNSYAPEKPGTRITHATPQASFSIRGISSMDDIALINVEGTGLAGVAGFASRVFDLMRQHTISVILISQASSEHSICFAVPKAQARAAQKALAEHLAFEIAQKQVENISVDSDCGILAIVGEGMVGARGILNKLSQSLAHANINVRAIAQGSSERNISIVIQQADINRALRAVHGGFHLSNKTLSIGLIGPGLVGQTLLKQLASTREKLSEEYGINLYLRGVANSKTMLLQHQHIDFDDAVAALASSDQQTDLTAFMQHIAAEDIPHAVIIDCTASQVVADHYLQFAQHGVHVITPNKRANSGDIDYYQQLHALTRTRPPYYLYETTVCAGLPVIKTLQDLLQTGDEVISIEGMVSGTLGYIFHALLQGEAFSAIIKQAKSLGYTEPDPRDDLSGMDVARKMVCLARELGFHTTLDEVNVHNLIPEPLRDGTIDAFLDGLPEYDAQMETIVQEAIQHNQRLGYIGSIDSTGQVNVGIKTFDNDHPFSRLKGADSMMIFRTQRYHTEPLVIQGPGAGADVTAAGIFADLLRLVSMVA